MGFLATIEALLNEHAAILGSGASVLAIGALIWAIITKPFSKEKKLDLTDETIKKIAPRSAEDQPKLTIAEFIRLRREVKADLEAELAIAHAKDKAQLLARIADLESQIANPVAALAKAQTRIADLEALLERSGNDIGGDRINEARDALEHGDFSIADEIFAEIETRREMDVQEAARAAFGRGEIAEEQVRWADAAEHYSRAARLAPGYETLIKAGMFLSRAGRDADAVWHEEQVVEIAKTEFGNEHEKVATAKNNLAESYRTIGRYDEAEPLYREALSIDCKTLGEAHPDYAIHLNNLAGLLGTTGRYDEAEPLFREALAIDCKTLGKAHPDYAIHLSNLAALLNETGRYDEAEPLYREALSIDRKTLGEAHPDYAIHLSNLAGLLGTTGRYDEAEPLLREALKIIRKVLGVAHPIYASSLNNLASLLCGTDRSDEAEPLLREALAVVEVALGAEHPNTRVVRKNLEIFLAERPD